MHPAIARRWGRYRQRLAAGHAAMGRREDALRHAVAAVRHLRHSTDVRTELVAAYDIVATCQQDLGQLEAAAAARQSAIHVLERTARRTTAWTLALVELGDLVRLQGHFDEAEAILTQALTDAPTDRDVDEPPVRAVVLNVLGIVYKDTGRYHAAQIAYAEAFELVATTCAPDDRAFAPLWHNIAGLAHARGHADQAATAATRAVEIRERALGPHHHLVAQDLAVQGAALLDLGRAAEAEQLFGRALAIFRARHPADQYDVAVNIATWRPADYSATTARAPKRYSVKGSSSSRRSSTATIPRSPDSSTTSLWRYELSTDSTRRVNCTVRRSPSCRTRFQRITRSPTPAYRT
jgi:tetratricopeptide (TPR) repeat protein